MSVVQSKPNFKEKYASPFYISQNGSWKVFQNLILDENVINITKLSEISNNYYNNSKHCNNFNLLVNNGGIDSVIKIRKPNESEISTNTKMIDTYHKAFEDFIASYEFLKNYTSYFSASNTDNCKFHPGTITSFNFTDCSLLGKVNQSKKQTHSAVIVDSFQKAFDLFLANYDLNEYLLSAPSLTEVSAPSLTEVSAPSLTEVSAPSLTEVENSVLESEKTSLNHRDHVKLNGCSYNLPENVCSKVNCFSEKTVKLNFDVNNKQLIKNSFPTNRVNSPKNICVGFELYAKPVNQPFTNKKSPTSKKINTDIKKKNVKPSNLLLNLKSSASSKLKNFCFSQKKTIHSPKYNKCRKVTNVESPDPVAKTCTNLVKTKYSIWDSTPRIMPREALLKRLLEKDPNFSLHHSETDSDS